LSRKCQGRSRIRASKPADHVLDAGVTFGDQTVALVVGFGVTSVSNPQEHKRLGQINGGRGRDRFIEVVDRRSITGSLDCSRWQRMRKRRAGDAFRIRSLFRVSPR